MKSAYRDDNDVLSEHIEEYDIDDSTVGDEDLHDVVAFKRLEDVDTDQAWNILEKLLATDIHTGCRFRDLYQSDPQNSEGGKVLWDGVEVTGLLYPYEDTFGPRDYEEVAQEVISVGSQVDNQMEKLNVMEEIDFESISNIR